MVLGIPWMQLHDVAIRFASNVLTFGSPYCLSNCNVKPAVPVAAEGISIPLPERPTANIAMISAIAMKMLSRKKGLEIHALSLFEINKAIEAKTTKDEWKNQIPVEYPDFLDRFDEKLAQELPPIDPTTTASPSLEARNPLSVLSMACQGTSSSP